MPSLEGTKGSEVTQGCMNPFKTRYLGYILFKKRILNTTLNIIYKDIIQSNSWQVCFNEVENFKARPIE